MGISLLIFFFFSLVASHSLLKIRHTPVGSIKISSILPAVFLCIRESARVHTFIEEIWVIMLLCCFCFVFGRCHSIYLHFPFLSFSFSFARSLSLLTPSWMLQISAKLDFLIMGLYVVCWCRLDVDHLFSSRSLISTWENHSDFFLIQLCVLYFFLDFRQIYLSFRLVGHHHNHHDCKQ